MKAERNAAEGFTVEFESEQELRDEHRSNLSFGALRLPTAENVPLHATLPVTLRGPWGAEASVRANVVGTLPDGLALAFDANGEELLLQLLVNPAPEALPPDEEVEEPAADPSDSKSENTWDRIRGMSQVEKILLAVKADRSERAALLLDNDPRVLLSVLRNPRLTMDEVVRIAKSSFLNYQIAEVIMKTSQWMGNGDVRVALIHNAKTPPAFALRILPTLPEAEIRAVARAGTSMALKQAALRLMQRKL
jgi:hypothetical protein